MTLRQYYRAALFFPLIPPLISGVVVYSTYPSNRGAADWAGTVLFVSLVGLAPYVPCALLFAFWEFRRPIAPRDFKLVLLSFPVACLILMVPVLAIRSRDQGFIDAIKGMSFFGPILLIVGYLYVGIIAGIAVICRRFGYITPEPKGE